MYRIENVVVMDAGPQSLARAAPPSLSSFQILQSPAWKKNPCSSDTKLLEAEAVSSSPRLKLGISIKNVVATSGSSADSSFPSSPLGRNLMSPEERKKKLWEWATLGVEGKPVAVHVESTNDPVGVTPVELREEKEDLHDSMDDTDQASRSSNESSGSEDETDINGEDLATVEPERKFYSSDTSADQVEYAAAFEAPVAVRSEATTPKKSGEEGTVTEKNDGEGGAFGSPLSVGPTSTQASPEKEGSGTDRSPLELAGSPPRGEGLGRRSGAVSREDGGDTDRIVPVRKIWAHDIEVEGGWEAERMRSLRDPTGRPRSPRGRSRTALVPAPAVALAASELPHGSEENKLSPSTGPEAEDTLAVHPELKREPDSDLSCADADSNLECQSSDSAPPNASEVVVEGETDPAPLGPSLAPFLPADSPLDIAGDEADTDSELSTAQGTSPVPLPPAPALASASASEVSEEIREDGIPHTPMAASTMPPSFSGGAIDALAVGSPRRSRKTWVIGSEGKTVPRSNSLSELPDQPTASGEGSESSVKLQEDTMELKVARNGVVREREELERQWKEGREELDRAAQMARALKTAVESLAKVRGLK